MEEVKQELSGIVERVVFRNEENGWTVLELAAEEEFHKVVGVLPTVQAGEQLKLTGEWVEHAKFGRQFRAHSCEHELPTDRAAVFRYLASGAIKGIGPVTASALVAQFGEDTLRVMEEEPERLCEVRGITAAKASKIAREYREQFGLREVILAFSGYGITQSEALRCWKRWGAGTVDTVRSNPYLLCSAGLYISFERADAICMSMDRLPDDPRRIEAGLLHVLRHNLQNGHTCLPSDKLIAAAAQMLGVDVINTGETLQDMVTRFTVRTESIGGQVFIFLPALHQAEKYAASRIRLMTGFHTEINEKIYQNLQTMEQKNGITYQERQREAVLAAVEKGVLINRRPRYG